MAYRLQLRARSFPLDPCIPLQPSNPNIAPAFNKGLPGLRQQEVFEEPRSKLRGLFDRKEFCLS